MVNNFEQIKTLLRFDNENEFYFLQILQRKKDRNLEDKEALKYVGSNNNSRLIKAYYIYSIEQLDKYEAEIIKLCELFNARACIGLNRRNSKNIALEMLALLAYDIKSNHVNQLSKIYSSVCGKHNNETDKTWIIDIDDTDLDFIKDVVDFTTLLQPEGFKVSSIIPTKNGYHLITKPFNSKKFSEAFPSLSLHKNNPTLLFCI